MTEEQQLDTGSVTVLDRWMLEREWRVARKAQNIWAQILVLLLERGSLPLQALVPPSVDSENLMEEQSEQTLGHSWPSAGFSCSKRPTATEAAICCTNTVGSTSLGQCLLRALL